MILKISLQPLGKFFFGGENSFNEGDEKNRRATYVLHSRYYPQQTGVLGLIRNQLLLQNGLLWDNSRKVSDKAAAKILIGEHGFKVGYTGNYGVIQKISPVFLANADGQVLPQAPRDDVQMAKDKETWPMTFNRKYGQHLLEKYSEKSGLYDSIYLPEETDNLCLDKAFATAQQVGITKAAKPDGNEVSDKDDEAGYYYQTFLTLAKESSVRGFVFYVEMTETTPYILNDTVAEFGGERSSFRMKVEETKLTEFPGPALAYKHTKIAPEMQAKPLVCLSPAYVKDMDKLRSESLLIVSQSLTFRFLKSEVENTTHHQALNRNGNAHGGLEESGLYQLLDRGSVIYFDPNIETTISNLFESTDFQNIGYNQFTIL
ncbi:MAG: type III-B CRISPR module-associated Cmr3 family protein [Saprospiraceae bacterium]|nr:type III-B CRISPR module-associated Cmr3 family protein [Saprospiraceae bacterium]MDZ4705761.1 type III-B CRISPR module-associated Cmr3 family protein [Saprospiraceae bacterium]